MAAVLDWLARYARPILLVVPGLLAIGALVTILGLPLIGWSIYGLGYLGLLLALPAVVAVYRASLDRTSWIAFGVLYLGVLLGVPVMLMVWGHYAQNPAVHDALTPYVITPLGMLAGAVAWIGLALFGLAAYGARAVPRGGAVLLVVAAAFALPAELGLFATVMWGLGIIIASTGLVWLAPQPEFRAPAFAGQRPDGVGSSR